MGHDRIAQLLSESFEVCTAEVLNLFLNTNLTPWDVQFCIGRAPVRISDIGQKIMICELWHNEGGVFQTTAENLCTLVQGSGESRWMRILSECAVLCGCISVLCRRGSDKVTISVPSGDFSAVMSAWYAAALGFPVDAILCCCNENSGIWDLLTQGMLRTGGIAEETVTPDSDHVVPDQLERLIWHSGGYEETERFLECCRRGKTYFPGNDVLYKLRRGMFSAVAGSDRIRNAISGVFRMCGYLMTADTAQAYAGLLDYRIRSGSTGTALVLSEKSPEKDCEQIACALGISREEVERYFVRH